MMAAGLSTPGIAGRLRTALAIALAVAAASGLACANARDFPAPAVDTVFADPTAVLPAEQSGTPAQTVASRFPPEWHSPDETTTGDEADGHIAMHHPAFNASAFAARPPPALSGIASSAPRWGDGRPRWLTDTMATLASATARSDPQTSPPGSALFNEAQITAMRKRLKLNRRQERFWPPVAVALRKISWKRTGRTVPDGVIQAGGKAIDPNSPEIQRLKTVIVPLIKSLNGEQKREVRLLVNVMGLGSLASAF